MDENSNEIPFLKDIDKISKSSSGLCPLINTVGKEAILNYIFAKWDNMKYFTRLKMRCLTLALIAEVSFAFLLSFIFIF